MNFNLDGGIWKLVLLALGGVCTYGANFFSTKLVADDDNEKRAKIKMMFKIIGLVLVVAAVVTIMFL